MTETSISQPVLDGLEWPSVKNLLESRAQSQPGKKRVETMAPLGREQAATRLKSISELKIGMIEGFTPDTSGLSFCAASAARAAKGSVMSQSEILSVRGTLLCSSRLRSFFSSHKDSMPTLYSFASELPDISEITSLLSRSFSDDGSLNASEYPQIGRIEKSILSLRSQIEERLSKMIHSPSLDGVLQEKIHSTRNDRYVLLVKANMKGRVKGSVQDISASSSTLFVEPEAVAALDDDLLMKKAELVRETEKIIAELSEQTGLYAEPIALHESFSSLVDFLYAAAKLSRDLKGNEPLLTDEPVLEIYRARHPLLQMLIGNDNIPNDIVLGGKRRCILITGANTGGKTVLLKTAGLCSLMALHGLHIPASPDSKVGIFSSITADIGDDQSIEKSLSTFSGQIVALNTMIENAGRGTLVLLDEIMAGTNPRYGASLARSFLESLVASGALVIATTHYPELRNLPPSDDRFINASVSFDVETLKPSYELAVGIPGSSYTFEIARKYGTQEHILNRALSLLSETELSVDALLETINRNVAELAEEKQRVNELRSELAEERDRCSVMRRRLEEETARIKKNESLSFLTDIREMKEQAARKITQLQTASMQKAVSIQSGLSEMETQISAKLKEMAQTSASQKYSPFDPACEPETHVFIVPLEKEGIIQSVNIQKRSAQVRLGSITSRYSFDELMIVEGKKKIQQAAPAYKPVKRNKADDPIPATIQTRYNTVDLRGLRVDEALFKLSDELDGMVRSGINSAVIIHGHGTGAMKEAVRKVMSSSPYVEKFRRGEQGEGGDGVTIALLSN